MDDILTFISICSAIYLIWFYNRRRKAKKILKEELAKLEELEKQTAAFYANINKVEEEKKRKEEEQRQEKIRTEKVSDAPIQEKVEQVKITKIDREEWQRRREEQEKREIARKLKERQRKRELEKIVTQELIEKGELFGDQPKRPPIPREVVDAVYARDKGVCVYCGSTENLQLDHIIPFSKGGATTIENLQLLCQKCNLEKSNHIG